MFCRQSARQVEVAMETYLYLEYRRPLAVFLNSCGKTAVPKMNQSYDEYIFMKLRSYAFNVERLLKSRCSIQTSRLLRKDS